MKKIKKYNVKIPKKEEVFDPRKDEIELPVIKPRKALLSPRRPAVSIKSIPVARSQSVSDEDEDEEVKVAPTELDVSLLEEQKEGSEGVETTQTLS
jgi:hypothetical protein